MLNEMVLYRVIFLKSLVGSYVPGGGDFYFYAKLILVPYPKLQLRPVLLDGKLYMVSLALWLFIILRSPHDVESVSTGK